MDGAERIKKRIIDLANGYEMKATEAKKKNNDGFAFIYWNISEELQFLADELEEVLFE